MEVPLVPVHPNLGQPHRVLQEGRSRVGGFPRKHVTDVRAGNRFEPSAAHPRLRLVRLMKTVLRLKRLHLFQVIILKLFEIFHSLFCCTF